jgi:phage tail protein X
VIQYVPKFEKRWNRWARPVNSSWRVDETYIRVRGKWHCLYRAVDKHGKTVDFLLRPDHGIAAAQAFFRKALAMSLPRWPRKVTLDGHRPSHAALRLLRREDPKWKYVRVRSCQYLNNITEQDHRAIKRRCASIALGRAACAGGYSVLFTTAIGMIQTLSAATAVGAGELQQVMKRYLKPSLLILDEVGYLPIDKLGANLLFQVISQRYERGSIAITTNRLFKRWAEIFNNDSNLPSALLDRLLHHAEVAFIEGDSFRAKDIVEADPVP